MDHFGGSNLINHHGGEREIVIIRRRENVLLAASFTSHPSDNLRIKVNKFQRVPLTEHHHRVIQFAKVL
jgi:hypothetical protein